MVPTYCNGIRIDAEQHKIEVSRIERYQEPERKDLLKISAVVCRP